MILKRSPNVLSFDTGKGGNRFLLFSLLRLTRDRLSMVIRLRQATIEDAPPLVRRKPGVLRPGFVGMQGQWSYDYGIQDFEYTLYCSGKASSHVVWPGQIFRAYCRRSDEGELSTLEVGGYSFVPSGLHLWFLRQGQTRVPP